MIRALLWRDGHTETLSREAIADAVTNRRDGGFVWVHIQSDKRSAEGLAELPVDLPPTVQRALIAGETRPRCDPVGSGVLVNLRAPKGDPNDAHDGDALVSLRLWAEKGMLLSVAFRLSTIVEPVERLFEQGRLHDPGDVIIALASLAAEQLDTIIAALGDEVDNLECTIDRNTPFSERRRVTALRSQAISYRRFVVPQRQALERLAALPLDWLDAGERDQVREASDRFARMGEELESVRERSAVLHEELTDLRSEKIDARSLQIAIVAMIFLPLTFITGLIGMNVEGIPFKDEPWAFWSIAGLCLAIALGIGGWFAIVRWSER